LEQLDERTVSWLESAIASFCGVGQVSDAVYVKHLLQTFASLAKNGHCVIVGRGAAHVLPPATTLRVRVVAPRALRVANVQQSRGLLAAEAQRWVDALDTERFRFVITNFHADSDDPANYDLTINSSRLGVSEWAKLIAQSAMICEEDLKKAGRTQKGPRV
jgi:cytidylate kinase